MKILHHGATEGVTGSCHLLVIDEHNSLLVDCGLFQGADITEHNENDVLRLEYSVFLGPRVVCIVLKGLES